MSKKCGRPQASAFLHGIRSGPEWRAAGHTGSAMAAQPAGLTMMRPWIRITRMITGRMNWK